MRKSIGTAVVACVAALAACTSAGEGEGGGWPATKVALAVVERTDAERAFHGVGELEAIRQVELASETAGRVTRIAFVSGQRVAKGDVLVQINDAPELAEQQRLEAQLRRAETVLARTRQLQEEKVATREELDNAQASYDMASSELRRIKAVIAQKAVRAPFHGAAGIRRVHEGQYLQAGDAIASLVDASTLNVNFSLTEQAVSHLRVDQPVDVRVDAWPEKVFKAKVAAIDPMIGKSRTVQVQAHLSNAGGALKAGMFAAIQVRPQTPSPVLTVPETAVTYTAYGQTVFVAQKSEQDALTVKRVSVKTGERWQGRVEIESGLKEGEKVVVSGQIKLSDGMQVEAKMHDSLRDTWPADGQKEGQREGQSS
ncbi:efflux RND transporter periplasmic adaptor subunit [Ottowia sp. VDI28]|uniref:efflux RND transporter periplasmic adaptor subunit n=1 Tax=Ottowia sp. VDI28 TaxID=3133968 RepID=UPI003C2AD157